jgi:hypothetical protein
MEPREVWARAYSQYIAEQSGDELLLHALERGQQRPIADQWTTQDFEPVRNALHDLFVAKKWIPTKQ